MAEKRGACPWSASSSAIDWFQARADFQGIASERSILVDCSRAGMPHSGTFPSFPSGV
jgi:hypothetical protein